PARTRARPAALPGHVLAVARGLAAHAPVPGSRGMALLLPEHAYEGDERRLRLLLARANTGERGALARRARPIPAHARGGHLLRSPVLAEPVRGRLPRLAGHRAPLGAPRGRGDLVRAADPPRGWRRARQGLRGCRGVS